MDRNFVEFEGVQKTYDGETLVVSDLNLNIRRGEFVTLLGPSGSGKSTVLMMLAGFEPPTRGIIRLNGKTLNSVAPFDRNISMVFQNYALFPHMTVSENIAYPLRVRKIGRSEIEERTLRALDLVQLGAFGNRYPRQLSGGQQQRVAVARALVFDPELVLMDEPLGALDKKLREEMQIEIKHIHDNLGITMVFVTHDQGEALTMSDRIAVFNDGRISRSTSRPRFTNALPISSWPILSAKRTCCRQLSKRQARIPSRCASRRARKSRPRRPSICSKARLPFSLSGRSDWQSAPKRTVSMICRQN